MARVVASPGSSSARSVRAHTAGAGHPHCRGPQLPIFPTAAPLVAHVATPCATALGAASPRSWTSPRSLPASSQHSPGVHNPEQQQVGKLASNAGLEAAVKAAKAKGKTALVIWFHYLGGSGSDWEQELRGKLADQIPWVEWYFPDAPQRPITNYGGRCASGWFDMVDLGDAWETPGLDDSVVAAHGFLRQAEALGLPASRIMLGGMSQGGVLALKAGLTYERPLAGIAAFSAWVPPCVTTAIRHASTPLFIGNGTKDEIARLAEARRGVALLKRAGCTNISEKHYPGLDHTWASYEREDVKKFLASVLPNVESGSGKPAGATMQTNLNWWNVATPLRKR